MKILRFYSYFRSSTAYRLRIALQLKQLTPQETVYINLKEGEQHSAKYREVNPAAAVPAFELQNGNTLTQSIAMLEWLEENFPNPAILPKDSDEKAKIRAFSQVIASDMHPVNNLRVLQYLTNELGHSPAIRQEWMHHWMHKGFAVCEKMLREENSDFCYGDRPLMADICLIPQIYNALRFELDMSAYPKLMKIYHHACQHPAFKQAAPENQPDCPAALRQAASC